MAVDPDAHRDQAPPFSTGCPVCETGTQGKISAALALEQIEWYEPGGGTAPRGTYRGTERVGGEVFASVPAHFDEFRAEPERFIDAGEHLVVVGRFRGRSKDGRGLDAPFAHVWTMRNGKAARFANHVEAGPWAAAWGG